MNTKEYKLYDGRTITFFFDDGKVGYITLHAMDALVGEIQKLAAERDAAITNAKELIATAQYAIKERDAAIADLRELNCDSCKHRFVLVSDEPCESCKHGCGLNDNWEWRGVQDVQSD